MTSRTARRMMGGEGGKEPPSTPEDRAAQLVNAAEAEFRKRWKLGTLRRVDPELHEALVDQRSLWGEAMVTRDAQDVQRHTEALVRGWKAAGERLAHYAASELCPTLVGMHEDTVVIISDDREGAEWTRNREHPGQRTLFVTPDEVAAMVNGLGDVALQVREMWPGAEIVRVVGTAGADAEEEDI